MCRTSKYVCLHLILEFLLLGVCFSSPLWAQRSSGSPSVHYRAQYTEIYSDNVETVAPTLGSAFVLGSIGSLTSAPSEVISGKVSVKGTYTSGSSLPFLQTNSSVLPLAGNHSYTVRFQYKILTAPTSFFYVQFLSFVAASQSNFLNGANIRGAAGTTGTVTLTSTLGNYSDYVVFWGNSGTNTGVISIDNIQITDEATGKVIAAEDAEAIAPTVKNGLQLQNATVITDPSEAISGKGSIRLASSGGFMTNSAVLPLAGNTVYTIKFDYRILSRGTSNNLCNLSFQPEGTTDPQLKVTIPGMQKNAAAAGSFSSGAQTAGASSYVLNLSVAPGVSLVIDNIVLYRQEVTTRNTPPPTWTRLLTAPFPRLGNRFEQRTDNTASLAWNEGAPYTYSVDQIERRLAFSDVIAGFSLQNQTQNPDSIHRIRALNPNVVILPDRFFEQQNLLQPPFDANIDLDYQLLQSTPNEWKATDTAGNVVYDRFNPYLFFMNVSDLAPVVNGQTWRTAFVNSSTTQIFPSGLWDGIYFSPFEDMLNPAFPHWDDPALFDYDWNRNRLRDETPAATSEMVRAGKMKMLQSLQSSTEGTQLMMGNSARPEFAFAPLLNGFGFECFNVWWSQPGAPITSSSPAAWRIAFEAYLRMQALERSPQINILQGCGGGSDINLTPRPSLQFHYLAATPEDIAKHRFTLGTALLGNGFYEYDLKDNLGAPYWFDEYSVDSNGTAIEDRTKKGYLGQPLSDAKELSAPGTLVFQEGFDSDALPNSFVGGPASAVSITHTPGEVISGTGSLVISNPDHTKQGSVGVRTNTTAVAFSAGVTYVLTLDWRILETLDFSIGFWISVMSGGQTLDQSFVPGVVAGDSGTTRFPFTIPSTGNWVINISILNGGGKVAIDNFKIYNGGVGPWRRDFESGFVLVNSFAQPHTFSPAELAGAFNRTGIHRILGTQAPDVNNGQPVTGDFTIGAFDAIILLADPIPAPGTQKFQIPDRGGISQTTSGNGSSVQVGSARIISYQGTTPSGMAVFDFRQNGVLISEAAVPASPLIQSGRTYAEIAGPVNTGIAITNPNDQDASITFYYTDATGANVLAGTTMVTANSQISAFLDQAPFLSQAADLRAVRSFTFASSVPVGVTALRGYTNERSEFLITTLPVSALDIPPTSTAPFAFPHYADGGGWTSAVVLVNPMDSTVTGTARFYSQGTTSKPGAPVTLSVNGTSASSFSYSIPARSSFKLQTAGADSSVQSGWVSVTPDVGNIAPFGLVVFSFQSNGVRVSEAGVPALPGSSAFRMYVENSVSLQTGIAIGNPSPSNVTVNFDLFNLDGTPTGITGSTAVPATGQIALFLNQIPGFSALPASFKGVLRISGANVFVTGLRGRYNERGDFLISTTVPVDETSQPSSAELVFPQIVDGGGYTTQIILFSGSAGQSASGVLQFVSQSGRPLVLGFQ